MMPENSDHVKQSAPQIVEIALDRAARRLRLRYENAQEFSLSAEYLRINSPSAEVRGHGPGQHILQVGKSQVGISAIHPVGRYAVLFEFDDGHKTGIYSFPYLYELATQFETRWQAYLDALSGAGATR